MKKRVTKTLRTIIVSALAACLAMAFAAPAVMAEEAPAAGGFTIGCNSLVTGDFALDTLSNNTIKGIEAAGNTAMSVCANGAIDQMVTDVENMIAAGVDGLVLWLPVDSMYLTVANKCEAAGVPFVLADKVPTDEQILAELLTYTTFVGAIAPDNPGHGIHAAEVALANGYTQAMIIAPGLGDGTATPRIAAFKEVFEAAGGTVVGEVHSDDANEVVSKTEDLYLANPDAQFFFCTGASTFGTSALNILKKYDDQEKKIITCELDSTIIESMSSEDYIISDTGDYWVCGYLASIMMDNYLAGNVWKDADGNAPVITDVPSFAVEPQYVDFYNNHVVGNDLYSAEEVNAMIGLTLDEFHDKVLQYSLPERALAKYAEGTVTAEELDAMGVEY